LCYNFIRIEDELYGSTVYLFKKKKKAACSQTKVRFIKEARENEGSNISLFKKQKKTCEAVVSHAEEGEVQQLR
jgi:hypothetical protein